ncbi:MAG: serine/threonine-protein kinase, partial [Opitutus sp.]
MKNSSALEEEIFLEGLTVAVSHRPDFVSSRCGKDQQLAERVNALLRGYEENSAYLEKPPASGSRGASAAFARSQRDHAPGDRVGPYRLMERIGEGGCGVVYRAEQEEPVRRQVALKVIKLGMDTHEFVARFEAERQALALMDHANIARVFDAGATAAGRPYFVMELVHGIPITRYCDEHRSTLAERLRIFVTVCEAVQHAHQKGVVHRDLKPSNILVGDDDGRAVPKVIDFGIVKAMHAPLTDSMFATQRPAFVGTPAYTSPEQIDAGNGDVDTRSDVFSLGVLLYELITGRPPLDREIWESAGFDETRRLIRDVEPPRPSTRVAALPDYQRLVIATLRRESPVRLSALLRSDLDWIVMKCVEKERSRRYETVNALAMDVRRYLENNPVLARPPSRSYRVGKFIRRHRTGVIASSLVTGSLVVGLISTGVALDSARVARDRAQIAERSEIRLRQQAELARKDEARRATRAIVDLASERLTQGRTTDALSHLATAAQRDPTNPNVAPLLASILTSRHFALPQAPIAKHDAAVLGIEFSLDGRHLLAVWEDGTIGWIDVRTGAIEKRAVPGPRMGFTRMPTRRHLLLYSPNGVIRSLNRETGLIVREIKFDYDAMGCRAIDDTTELFSTKLTSNQMMVGNAETGETVGDPVPYEGYFGAGGKWIAWSPNGTGEPTKRVRFRRTDGDHAETTIEFPFAFVPGKLATSPDGTRMATVQREAGEFHLWIWSLPDGKNVAKSAWLERSAYTFYSPDGRFVFCWGQGLEMYAAETAQLIARMPSAGVFVDETRYGFSPNGRTLATWGPSDIVELWDLDGNGRSLATLRHGETVDRVSFSGDGKILMSTGENEVRVWDTTTGDLIAEPAVHLRGVPAVALMPSGNEVAVGTSDGEIYRFPASKRGAQPLELEREGTLPVAFLPGSPTRVLRMGTKSARFLELASGHELGPRLDYREPIRA